MPNWCENTISITGPAEKLSPMYTKLIEDGDEGLCSILYPPPADMFKGNLGENERKDCAEKGIPNWYDWQSSNWGTKWDVTAQNVEIEYEDDEQLEVSFDTAWAPPEPICYRLREMFKDLHFSWFYDEPGMETAGYL